MTRPVHAAARPSRAAAAFARAGAALLILAAAPSAAQVRVRAVDAEARPIPAVQVEWYAPGELLGTILTGADGVAEIPSDRWDEAVRIHLRFVGLETRVVQVRDIPADGVIQLERRAIELDGLQVEVGELCPIADDPRARAAWSQVADRYSPDTGRRARSAFFGRTRARVSGAALHEDRGDEDGSGVHLAQSGGGVIHGGDRVFRPLDQRVREDGYAWPPFFETASVRQLDWAYPELDRLDAHHFASPAFGALHDFQILEESGDRTKLAFCGRGSADRASVNGTITLITGRSFTDAEWRFETPEKPEGAGGRVTFAEVWDANGDRHLVAEYGAFYRRSGDGTDRFVIERTTDALWMVFSTDDHPCSSGRSIYGVPPTTAKGEASARCNEPYWRGATTGSR